MTYYRFPERKYSKVLLGMLLTALLLLSRESMYTTIVVDFAASQLVTLGLLLVLGGAFLVTNRTRLREIFTDPRVWAAGIIAVAMLLPMAAKQDWRLMYFSILLGSFVAVLFSYFATTEEIGRVYVVMMAVLAGYSLLTHYCLRYLAEGGILPVPTFANYNGYEFYSFGISVESLTFVKNRNFGLFREPGVYQFFLILALFLNNYRMEWQKNWQLWLINAVLALTVFSTFATGGVIEMGLLAAVLFFDKKWYKSKLGLGLCIGAVACVGGAMAYILINKGPLYQDLYYMFYKLVSPEESTVSRLGSIVINLQMFARSPLVGQPLPEILDAIQDNTASTLILFASLGILGGLVHVAGWFALVWDRRRHIFVNLCLVLVLFMSFNTQNLTWDIFFWLLPGMALLEKGIPMAKRLLPGKKE